MLGRQTSAFVLGSDVGVHRAVIVQTSLPIVQDLLEQHKSATGEFDFDDQITGSRRARRRARHASWSGDAVAVDRFD